MKVFNLIVSTFAFMFVTVGGACLLSEEIFGEHYAKFVIVLPALLIGMHSRRIVQKILGYTMEEAIKENQNEA